MTTDTRTGLLIVESTDEYFEPVSNRWVRVPSFWINDFVLSHSHAIRSRSHHSEPLTTAHQLTQGGGK